MIHKLQFGAKILLCIVAGFFILMAFDVFDIEATIWEQIGGFMISISPGLILIGILILFWKNERILAYLCFGFATAWLIFIIVKGNLPDMIGGILIIDIPLVITGIILLISSKK